MAKLNQIKAGQFAQENLLLSKEDEKILDSYLSLIFQDENFILRELSQLGRFDKDTVNQIDERHLLFHIREDDWLAKFVYMRLDRIRTAELSTRTENDASKPVLKYFSPKKIEAYINQSVNFKNERAKYVENVVKAYIKILRDGNKDDFAVTGYKKEIYRKNVDYDKIFRYKVEKAMRFLSFGVNAFQRAIEKNADLWRDQVRRITFENNFHVKRYLEPETKTKLQCVAPHKLAEINQFLEDIYQKWSTARDYNYYHDNQRAIDRLNYASSSMKMSEAEYKRISREVKENIGQYKVMIAKAKSSIRNKRERQKYWDTHQPKSNGWEIEEIDEEKLRYWDGHQPATNGPEAAAIDEEALSYWNTHQPESNDIYYVPERRRDPEFWETHQPETNDGRPTPKKDKDESRWNREQPTQNK